MNALLVVTVFALFKLSHFQEIPVSQRIINGVDLLLANNIYSLQLVRDVEIMYTKSEVAYKNENLCQVCEHVVDSIIKKRRDGLDKNNMQQYFNSLCKLFTTWDATACEGYINIETDAILYMIDNKRDLDGQRVCSIYFQTHGCVDPKRKHWDIVMPTRERSKTRRVSMIGGGVSTTKKILHLTDFHYDPLYEPGNDAKCEYQLCCQKGSGKPKHPEDAAGYWGDYNFCDMPWHSVIDVFKHIKKQHPRIDYMFYTGDIISHRSWDTSIAANTEDIKRMYSQLADSFGNTKLYPVLGNHESHPTDFWSSSNVTSEKISTRWVFNLMSQEWSRWLPQEALETVKRGGFYTVVLNPKQRIIALNSNVCYVANLWLLFNDRDPFGQLQWLADTLARAEAEGQLVHILSHVPPGNVQCLVNWNEVFVKIVNRFSHIITGQFNGHTHYDEFRVFYDKSKTSVTNVAYNGGSFTTFVGLNPNYRVYDLDSKTYEVSDYEQWTYNMTEANVRPNAGPKWYKLYSFKEAYGIPSMGLDDLGKLVERMRSDKALMEQYYRFEVRDSDAAMKKGCDEACLEGKLCAIKGVNFVDSVLCNDS